MSTADVWVRAYIDNRFAPVPQDGDTHHWPRDERPQVCLTAQDIARAFAVPFPMVGLPDTEPARDRLRMMIADIENGFRCRRCAGLLPMDTDSPDEICRCGAQW